MLELECCFGCLLVDMLVDRWTFCDSGCREGVSSETNNSVLNWDN